jgi:hypothetical protein
VTVTLRAANRSSRPVTDLTVSMTYDPAVREDASPITLPTTDPPMPWAPGGTGTQINEFEAKSNGLARYDIHVSSNASSRCDLDFRDAGWTATAI